MPSGSTRGNRIYRWLYALWGLSFAVVVYLSLRPEPELPGILWNADKAGHFLAYFWLAVLPALMARKPMRLLPLWLALIVLGVILEVSQLHISGRMFSLGDLIANTAGVLVGGGTGILCRNKFLPFSPEEG